MKYKLLCLFLVCAACSKKDISSTEELDEYIPAEVITNISYGTNAAQVYDLYLPKNRSFSTTKTLVFVHGGGWIQGDKSDMQEYIPLLQNSHPDLAIANLNYRLAQPPAIAAFPFQFLDIGLALDHLSREAEELGIKPEFALIGLSAGGHLALQYDSAYDVEDQVKLVCSIVGPTNFTDPFYSENPDFSDALEYLIDESQYSGITDLARAISPAYLVHDGSSPTILFYGQDDPLVPASNGAFLKAQLDAAGVANSFTLYQGGHGDWNDEANTNLQLQLNNFISDHFAAEN